MAGRGESVYVTLVDRATNDLDRPREIFHDSESKVLAPGQREVTISQHLAGWLLRFSQQHHIHTTDGRFLCRFGLKDAPEDFLLHLGPEAADCSPVERDLLVGEGWNTAAVGRPGMKLYGPGDIVQTIKGPVRLPSSLGGLDNQGVAGSRVASGER